MFCERLNGKSRIKRNLFILRFVSSIVLICSVSFFAGTANSEEPCPCQDAHPYPRPIAYYKLDSDLLDSSSNALFFGNPKNLTSVGSALYSSGMDGQSLGLDGSFYVKATDSGPKDRFDFGSNEDFSFSIWFKTSASVDDNYMLTKGTSGAGYRVFLNSGGFVNVTVNDGVSQVTLTSTVNTNDGSWHHFAGSFDKGGLGKIYIDGQPDTQASIASILAIENASDFAIGLGPVGTYFNGDIDEVKIYVEALTDQEALNIFNQRTVAYYKFDSNANDSSENGNDGTPFLLNGGGWVPGIRDNAADIWIGDYIEIPDSSSLDTTTDAITISAWVYLVSGDATNIITKSSLSSPGEDSYRLFHYYSSDELSFELADAGTGEWFGGNMGVDLSYVSWYHVVGVYDGEEVSLYLNGVKGTTPVSHTGSIKTSSAPVHIGARGPSGPNALDGIIDELKIFNTALPHEEICRLYWETPGVLNDVVPGDFEPDGSIDIDDLNYLTSFWLDNDCQTPEWCRNADLDKSGTVNLVDMAIVASNWLSEYELFNP